ncbi:MAG: hypothetical protein ABJL35_15005 [Parasphingorhabdus sp.]
MKITPAVTRRVVSIAGGLLLWLSIVFNAIYSSPTAAQASRT